MIESSGSDDDYGNSFMSQSAPKRRKTTNHTRQAKQGTHHIHIVRKVLYNIDLHWISDKYVSELSNDDDNEEEEEEEESDGSDDNWGSTPRKRTTKRNNNRITQRKNHNSG